MSALGKEKYVAFCCVDDYYNTNDWEDSVGTESNEADNEDNNIHATLDAYDPLTRLEQVPGSSFVDARKYFLFVTSMQVRFVCNEWENSLTFLQRQIKQHVSQTIPCYPIVTSRLAQHQLPNGTANAP